MNSPTPNAALIARLTSTPLLSAEDHRRALIAMGALCDTSEEASKQGGGGIQSNFRWPAGIGIDLPYMRTLAGLMRQLQDWEVPFSVEWQPGCPCVVAVYGYRVECRDVLAGLYAACIEAGLRSHPAHERRGLAVEVKDDGEAVAEQAAPADGGAP